MADGMVLKSVSGTPYLTLDDSGNLTITGTFTAGAVSPTTSLWADNVVTYWGTGSDIGVSWDGTRLNVTQALANSEIRWGVDGAGIDQRWYGDTAGRSLLWDQSQNGLIFSDGTLLALGDSGDDLVSHDGTNSKWIHTTGDMTFDNTNVTGHTYMDLGTDTSATSWGVRGNGGSEWLSVDGAGTITQLDAATRLVKGATTGTGRVIDVVGPDLTHGVKTVVLEVTVSPAAIETAVLTLPAKSRVVCLQANIEAALTGGGTTATVSFGITGDVDAYGTMMAAGVQSDLLTKNAKADFIGSVAAGAGASLGVWAPAAVSIKAIGAATGGTSAGNTALTVGSIKVRIVYETLMSLVDAA